MQGGWRVPNLANAGDTLVCCCSNRHLLLCTIYHAHPVHLFFWHLLVDRYEDPVLKAMDQAGDARQRKVLLEHALTANASDLPPSTVHEYRLTSHSDPHAPGKRPLPPSTGVRGISRSQLR